ncbi:TIR domain-containing protein [Actinotalea subterranea]|uniref:TIR domain-containing protein n=1 Tax=Actinotalea subterranea TaxID=2607497 RepID=UPI0011EDCCFA|nr:TIR domain-containing protein [Actinotalea subterranea]
MATKTVFYSFHYKRDVSRVQLVRNINALEGQPLLNAQQWEEVKRRGQKAVVDWIDTEMRHKRAVVVLIGQETASRPWVIYEIQKAWNEKKPLVGIRIHSLSSFGSADRPGANPFDKASGVSGVPIFDPTRTDWRGDVDTKASYANLVSNLEGWVAQAKARMW